MPKVSVIIPVFNRFDFLRRSLLCLMNQSFIVDEVVVTDDGSDDDIPELLKNAFTDFPFELKYVRQENKGFRLSRCRNNGVRISTGDFLIFLDQDIIYTKKFISTFIEHAASDKFLVAWPIRLKSKQMPKLTDEMILAGDFSSLITKEQCARVTKQYQKDLFYQFCKKINVRDIGPKLRSGLFAVSRDNYFKVNGFDEKYQGWGNEDDDMGRRFHAAGIVGKNPFRHEFPLHMWHEPNHDEKKRVNLLYYQQRKKQIHHGAFYCEYGISNPLGEEQPVVVEI
jgi:glycosyltransferase involved in cell wall biosynthesis